jgi:hypothetical protein
MAMDTSQKSLAADHRLAGIITRAALNRDAAHVELALELATRAPARRLTFNRVQ